MRNTQSKKNETMSALVLTDGELRTLALLCEFHLDNDPPDEFYPDKDLKSLKEKVLAIQGWSARC